MEELSGRKQKHPVLKLELDIIDKESINNHGQLIEKKMDRCHLTPSPYSVLSTHSNDMCVFELVLCGDKEGGEVLGEEPSEGRRVGKQHLRESRCVTANFQPNTRNFPFVQNLVSP